MAAWIQHMFKKIATSRIYLSALLLGLTINTHSLAESGDAEAGKQKSASCVACHGQDGNSPLDQFPKIAGQVPGFVAAQLAMFKSAERDNPVMMGMVGALNDQDMLDLDAFYSSQTMTVEAVPSDRVEEAKAGEAIYRGGIAEFNVPACMACHGPSGAGIPPNYPRLGGQYAAYIEAQLLAYKSGARKAPMMNDIAFPLSEEQIKQLALYISALN